MSGELERLRAKTPLQLAAILEQYIAAEKPDDPIIRVRADWLQLAADMLRLLARDVGAGLDETKRQIARHAIVQASIHLANGDTTGTHEDLTVALDALAAARHPEEGVET